MYKGWKLTYNETTRHKITENKVKKNFLKMSTRGCNMFVIRTNGIVIHSQGLFIACLQLPYSLHCYVYVAGICGNPAFPEMPRQFRKCLGFPQLPRHFRKCLCSCRIRFQWHLFWQCSKSGKRQNIKNNQLLH
jgi:hypothetical protein